MLIYIIFYPTEYFNIKPYNFILLYESSFSNNMTNPMLSLSLNLFKNTSVNSNVDSVKTYKKHNAKIRQP